MTLDSLSQRPSNTISTHAFQETQNGKSRSKSGERFVTHTHSIEPSDNDIFDNIIPQPGATHRVGSRGQLDNKTRGLGVSGRSQSLSKSSHLKQRSNLNSDHGLNAYSAGEDEEDSFGDLPPMPKSGFGNRGNSSESSAPSPDRRNDRSSSKQSVSVPARRSSRARGQSSESSSERASHGNQDSDALRQITAAELNQAREVLAAAEAIAQDSASVQTERSATPPPIGRVRRRTGNGSDSGDTAPSLRPTTPDTAVFTNKKSQLLGVARRNSQGSLASHRSQRSSKSRPHHGSAQASVQDQSRPSQESNRHAPGTRQSSKSRPRKDRMEGFDEDDEDDEFFPRRIPDSSHHSGGGPRYASLTASSSAHRPMSTTKRAFSNDALSVSGRLPADRRSIISHASSTVLPDFFSHEIFQIVRRNPTTAHQLLKFSETRVCSENIEFLNQVDEYQKALNNLTNILGTINKGFISSQSRNQLDVPDEVVRYVNKDIRSLAGRTLPGMEMVFADMQAMIEELVFTNVYPRFVRYQLGLSATQALASDRHKYAGLGDCFCLTNPNKADNPILFASDGFVKVTGYSRPEIIPRNCRFLQGPQTDRVPIRRLKQGIAECRESVELILNYKKNGDPFWNLLYVAPLYNENGKLAFFIGGQVNCSTTIHSNADIMKVLSLSNSTELDERANSAPAPVPQKHGPLPSARKAFLKALGVRVDAAKMTPGPSGMENNVLDRMEGRDLDAQMKEFYTAYSKYIVVQADTFVIQYYSEGVLDTLNPANNTGLMAGQEIFRFFKQNMVTKETDYRSRVRSAVRSGNPISLELRLQTRRSARFRGDEVFLTHWTPLKDENSATHWVVITLASSM